MSCIFSFKHTHTNGTLRKKGKYKHKTPTRRRLLVVVGTEVITIATPARGVVIFIRVDWQRVMLPMAMSMPLELQVAAVECEGVLDDGTACVHAIKS